MNRNNSKSRGYDLFIVSLFFFCFVSFLSHFFLLGFLLIAIGLFFIWSQERGFRGKGAARNVQYAGFWRRLGSLTVDGGVFSSFFLFLLLLLRKNIYDYWINAFYCLICLGVTLYTLKRWSQTPGKMVMGIHVLKNDFSSITLKQILFRQSLDVFFNFWCLVKALLITGGITTAGMLLVGSQDPFSFPSNILKIIEDKLPYFFIIWYFSEMVILLINHKKRALHDYLADTIVVVKKKSVPRWTWWVVAASILIIFSDFYISWIHGDLAAETLAAKGDPTYEEILGNDYFRGRRGFHKDYTLAFQWFEKAAVQQNAIAQYYLGEMYEKVWECILIKIKPFNGIPALR